MRKIIYLVVVLLVASITTAEEWMTFTTDDGLAHNICRCVAVDHDGVVWVGHGDVFSGVGGVSSWDGETWTTYHSWTTDFALRSDFINDIAVDENNNKWFATGTVLYPGGLTKFDGTDWTRFDFDTLMPMGENLYCTVVEHNSSSVFCDFSLILIKMQHDEINYIYTTPLGVFSMYIDTAEVLLIGTDCGLFILDYPLYYDFDSTLTIFVKDIKMLNESILLATHTKGLLLIGDDSYSYQDTSTGLLSNQLTSIFVDSDSSIWVGSYRGVNKFVEPDWLDYRTDSLYPRSLSMDFAQDDNKNIYIATDTGVSIYNEAFIRWAIEEEDEETINTHFRGENVFLLEDDNKISNIRVYDIRGKLLSEEKSLSKLQINLQNYNSGLYLINLRINEQPFCFKYVNIK